MPRRSPLLLFLLLGSTLCLCVLFSWASDPSLSAVRFNRKGWRYLYWVDGSAEMSMLSSILEGRDVKTHGTWQRATSGLRHGADLKWSFSFSRLHPSRSSQLLNHFCNSEEVDHKDEMARRLQQKFGNSIPFLPASYFLRKEMAGEDEQTKSDRQAFLAAQLPPRSSMWIVKPAVSGRGIGISVVRTKEEVLQVVNNDRLNQTFVVQEYLERPHILMKRKYDIRQFVLVTSLNPLIIYINSEYYLRFSALEYSKDDLSRREIHLTNMQVQKNAKEFHSSPVKQSQWSSREFEEYLSHTQGPEFYSTVLRPKIEELVIKSLSVWRPEGHRPLTFELLGFDILLDEELNPFLIEINSNPGLHLNTEQVKTHHRNVLEGLVSVVLDHRTDVDVTQCVHKIKLSAMDEMEGAPRESITKQIGVWQLKHCGPVHPNVPENCQDGQAPQAGDSFYQGPAVRQSRFNVATETEEKMQALREMRELLEQRRQQRQQQQQQQEKKTEL